MSFGASVAGRADRNSRFGLVRPDLLFLGIVPFCLCCPFALSWPIKRTHKEIPKKVRDTIRTCPEDFFSTTLTLQSLLFFNFLAFFVFRFSLLFLAFFLPFPRILGVPRRDKPLLFWGKTPAFSKKALKTFSALINYWGFFSSLILGTSRRANT